MNIDLSGLKEVKMPVEPSWFPLASGWWFLFVIFVFLCLLTSSVALRSYFSAKAYALRMLKVLKNASISDIEFAKEVSKLLKRVAILKFGANQVARLSDEKWAEFLKAEGLGLTQEQATFIAYAAYVPEDAGDKLTKKELYPAVRSTLIHLFKRKKK